MLRQAHRHGVVQALAGLEVLGREDDGHNRNCVLQEDGILQRHRDRWCGHCPRSSPRGCPHFCGCGPPPALPGCRLLVEQGGILRPALQMPQMPMELGHSCPDAATLLGSNRQALHCTQCSGRWRQRCRCCAECSRPREVLQDCTEPAFCFRALQCQKPHGQCVGKTCCLLQAPECGMTLQQLRGQRPVAWIAHGEPQDEIRKDGQCK
mmetsp:Transcript_78929/g.183086  ORF Transcript_78929/g.183086 Transcript_78929/m.183086 type:complete len:208 (+) Transcript_78929:851-1474(+)